MREERRQPVGRVIAVPRTVVSLAGENVCRNPFPRDAGAFHRNVRR